MMDPNALKALKVAKTELENEAERIEEALETIEALLAPVKKRKRRANGAAAKTAMAERMRKFHAETKEKANGKKKRRPVRTPAERKKLVAKIRKISKDQEISIRAACEKVGVHETSYYKWIR